MGWLHVAPAVSSLAGYHVPCATSQSRSILRRLRRVVGTKTRTEFVGIYFLSAPILTLAPNRLKYRLSLKECQARPVTTKVFGYRDWTSFHQRAGQQCSFRARRVV